MLFGSLCDSVIWGKWSTHVWWHWFWFLFFFYLPQLTNSIQPYHSISMDFHNKPLSLKPKKGKLVILGYEIRVYHNILYCICAWIPVLSQVNGASYFYCKLSENWSNPHLFGSYPMLSYKLWWSKWEMPPIGSCVWSLRPYLVVLFVTVIEFVEGRNLLEDVHHWGCRGRLWVFIAAFHFRFFLSDFCVWMKCN